MTSSDYRRSSEENCQPPKRRRRGIRLAVSPNLLEPKSGCECLRRHLIEHANRLLYFHSPRKTIATAQNLYHRFHLFFPRKDFGYQVRLVRAVQRENHTHSLACLGCDARRPLRVLEDARHLEETSRNSHGLVSRSLPGTSSKIQVYRWGD